MEGFERFDRFDVERYHTELVRLTLIKNEQPVTNRAKSKPYDLRDEPKAPMTNPKKPTLSMAASGRWARWAVIALCLVLPVAGSSALVTEMAETHMAKYVVELTEFPVASTSIGPVLRRGRATAQHLVWATRSQSTACGQNRNRLSSPSHGRPRIRPVGEHDHRNGIGAPLRC